MPSWRSSFSAHGSPDAILSKGCVAVGACAPSGEAMRKILILGAGKIGGAIVDMLAATGDYDITIADQNAGFLGLIPAQKAKRERIDVSDAAALGRTIRGQEAVISALPFFLNPAVAKIAGENGAHYFDLTEDVATTRA